MPTTGGIALRLLMIGERRVVVDSVEVARNGEGEDEDEEEEKDEDEDEDDGDVLMCTRPLSDSGSKPHSRHTFARTNSTVNEWLRGNTTASLGCVCDHIHTKPQGLCVILTHAQVPFHSEEVRRFVSRSRTSVTVDATLTQPPTPRHVERTLLSERIKTLQPALR